MKNVPDNFVQDIFYFRGIFYGFGEEDLIPSKLQQSARGRDHTPS